ncbi:zinc ABC transporter substrate-binding protein [Actibacterium sp. D379-3]
MRLPLTLSAALMTSPLWADVPAVVTDIPAIHSLAAQVMGDLGQPAVLLDKGADPHHFQLRPSQARALSQADLLFWIGPELTPWLDRAIGGVGLRGDAVELLEAEGTVIRAFGEDHEDHEVHEDEHEEDHDTDHADADGHDHAHDGLDPHAWLDPQNARVWIGVMARHLAQADPEHTDRYAANATQAVATVDAAEARARAILAPVGATPVMVFHDAYGYFAAALGVNVAGSIALGDAASPGAGRLAAIRAELAHEGAVCIFPEAQHDPAYIEAVVTGTGVRVGAPLDPSGTALAYGPALYGDLLTGLAQTIADCVTAP